jgi:hypothetical protein
MSVTLVIEPGTTLLIPSGPSHDPGRFHLFIALTAPQCIDVADPVLFVPMVSLSTLAASRPFDSACLLRAGEHPFVRHDSYVAYGLAICQPLSKLEAGIQRGMYELREPLTPTILERVLKGALESKHIKPRIRGLCR